MTAERDEARERPAVGAGVIFAVTAAFIVFVAASIVVLYLYYQSLAHNPTFVRAEEFPSPRLQTHWDGLRDPEVAKQRADLEHFRWIDRAHGVFQIPIERAMRLVAARGAKAYEPVTPEKGGQGRQPEGGSAQ
jgi:hypothetical protein